MASLTDAERATVTDELFTEEGEVSPFKMSLAIINLRSDFRDLKARVMMWGAISSALAALAVLSPHVHGIGPAVESFIAFVKGH